MPDMDYKEAWEDMKAVTKTVYKACTGNLDGPFEDDRTVEYHHGYTVATKHILQGMEMHENGTAHTFSAPAPCPDPIQD